MFMHRAARYVAERGIRQFMDIGTGIPTSPNLHEVGPGGRAGGPALFRRRARRRPEGMTVHIERSRPYYSEGRFAGWPANYGFWGWEQEVVSIFVAGWLGPLKGVHARDMTRPFEPVQVRSTDGGRTWSQEPFTAPTPGSSTLSGDEHVVRDLQVAPGLTPEDFVPLEEPIAFDHPETIVLCARTDLAAGSVSWFYVSRDRARSWSGPHRLPDLGGQGISARTDIVPLSSHEALFMLTEPKSDGSEGRVFCAWTGDGGRTFERRGWVGEEPAGWTIMPASMRLADGLVISALRCAGLDTGLETRPHWIDLYVSEDKGHSWQLLSRPVPDTGPGGNPPAMVRLPDHRLVLCFGYRAEPAGLRYVVSDDEGRTWSDPQVVTGDVAMGDMGYPRALVMPDNSVLAVYYANQGDESERYIEAVRWTP